MALKGQKRGDALQTREQAVGYWKARFGIETLT